MSQDIQTVLRRWNGLNKEASIWDFADRDPDIFDIDGDCLVYLSRHLLEKQRHSFVVSVEALIGAKCQPLFEYLDTTKEVNYLLPGRNTRSKHRSCTLCLEIPDLLNIKELQLYHITTRNFFAWLMNKPIIGSDPASALLSLKLRMDVWRLPSVDNLSDLYRYARRQGYGDLGDMSLFLNNHLRGDTIFPDDYKLVTSMTRCSNSSTDDPANKFKISMRRHLQNMQRWQSLRPSAHESEDDFSLTQTDRDTTDYLMSGAISLDPIKLSRVKPSRVNTEPSLKFSKRPYLSRLLPEFNQGDIRRSKRRSLDSSIYSLPSIPHGSIEDVAQELEIRSSWTPSLTREHAACVSQESKVLQRTSTLAKSSHGLGGDAAIPQSSQPTHTQLLNAKTNISRPPSPIREESTELTAPMLPTKNPRRYSLPTINASTNRDSSSFSPRDWSTQSNFPQDCRSVVAAPALGVTAATTTEHEKSLCVYASLPSHALFDCKTCRKPRPPKNIRQSLTARRSATTPNSRRVSFDIGIGDSQLHTKVNSRDKIAPNLNQPSVPVDLESGTIPTRFPSLKRSSAGVQGVDRQERVLQHHSAATKSSRIFHHRNASEPSISSRKAPEDVQKRNTVTIEIKQARYMDATTPGESMSIEEIVRKLPTQASVTHRTGPRDLASQKLVEASSEIATGSSDIVPSSTYNNPSKGNHRLSGSFGDLTTTKEHRIPKDSINTHDSDTELMDNMLDSIMVPSANSIQSNAAFTGAKHRTVRIENIGRLDRASSTGKVRKPVHPEEATSGFVKRILRNSLRSWSTKRQPLESETYQGNILVMDSSGKFSTMSSPVNDTMTFWEEKKLNDLRDDERVKTPVCELP